MLTDVLPAVGIAFQTRDAYVTCKKSGGISKGDVGEFAFLAAGSENNRVGDADSKFAVINGVSSAVGGSYTPVDYLIFAIALDDIAENQKGLVRISGIVDANVAAAVAAAGEPLSVVQATGNLTPASTVTTKTVGIALETIGAAGTISVLFDGYYGWGVGS